MKKITYFIFIITLSAYLIGCAATYDDATSNYSNNNIIVNNSNNFNSNNNLNNSNQNNNNNAGYQVLSPGDYNSNMTVDSRQREYILHIPTGYSPAIEYPLVIVLHGGYGNAADIVQSTKFNDLADNVIGQFIVAYPDAFIDHWADGRGTTTEEIMGVDDVKFISNLVDEIKQTVNLNLKKIYVCGISNGGMMTYRIGIERSDKFAAIGVVAGCIAQNISSQIPTDPVSVIHFHGTDDWLVPYAGGVVPLGAGGQVVSAEGSGWFWVNKNNTDSSPTVTALPDQLPDDGTTVVKYAFSNGDNNTEVVFYKIIGGGHTWPINTNLRYSKVTPSGLLTECHDVDATRLIWDFFKNKAKP